MRPKVGAAAQKNGRLQRQERPSQEGAVAAQKESAIRESSAGTEGVSESAEKSELQNIGRKEVFFLISEREQEQSQRANWPL